VASLHQTAADAAYSYCYYEIYLVLSLGTAPVIPAFARMAKLTVNSSRRASAVVVDRNEKPLVEIRPRRPIVDNFRTLS
jgi:hypothetical protein